MAVDAKKTRPNWDRYFLDMCEAVAARATCDRGKCGAVIVKDKRIMTTGYVGAQQGCRTATKQDMTCAKLPMATEK